MCVSFTDQRWQKYPGQRVQRQRIPSHHYRTGGRNIHYHPSVDRMLPVLLSTPAPGHTVEEIARQWVFQRRCA